MSAPAAVIVGAGIGGLAAAIALQRSGVTVRMQRLCAYLVVGYARPLEISGTMSLVHLLALLPANTM